MMDREIDLGLYGEGGEYMDILYRIAAVTDQGLFWASDIIRTEAQVKEDMIDILAKSPEMFLCVIGGGTRSELENIKALASVYFTRTGIFLSVLPVCFIPIETMYLKASLNAARNAIELNGKPGDRDKVYSYIEPDSEWGDRLKKYCYRGCWDSALGESDGSL